MDRRAPGGMTAPSDKHFIHGALFMLANRMQTLGDRLTGEITTKQWFTLLVVDRCGDPHPSITKVAGWAGTSRQNTAKILAGLEKKGYVELAPLPHDKRSQGVFLTGKALAHMGEISQVGNVFIDQMFAGVSDAELKTVRNVFYKLFENCDRIEEAQ